MDHQPPSAFGYPFLLLFCLTSVTFLNYQLNLVLKAEICFFFIWLGRRWSPFRMSVNVYVILFWNWGMWMVRILQWTILKFTNMSLVQLDLAPLLVWILFIQFSSWDVIFMVNFREAFGLGLLFIEHDVDWVPNNWPREYVISVVHRKGNCIYFRHFGEFGY